MIGGLGFGQIFSLVHSLCLVLAIGLAGLGLLSAGLAGPAPFSTDWDNRVGGPRPGLGRGHASGPGSQEIGVLTPAFFSH